MEFEAVVRRRHMVRAYQPRPVEDEKEVFFSDNSRWEESYEPVRPGGLMAGFLPKINTSAEAVQEISS